MAGLLETIMSGVTRATPEEESSLFNYHNAYGEVIGDKAYINETRLKDEGSTGDFVGDMMFGEALHNLDKTSPYWYNRLRVAAEVDEDVMQWKDDSYDFVRRKPHNPHLEGELRTKEDWWDVSRFDQVVGGYFLGGKNANVSSMRNWGKDLPFGTTFRKELEVFKKALGQDGAMSTKEIGKYPDVGWTNVNDPIPVRVFLNNMPHEDRVKVEAFRQKMETTGQPEKFQEFISGIMGGNK